MSVIVKGMEMPENCFECPCCRHDNTNSFQKEQCNLTLDVFDAGYYERFEGRAQNCPLVSLPDKHGRLVDADALETHEQLEPFGNGEYEYVEVVYKDDIDDAPTIVEAEDSE